jgi:putative hydrolase of the HAD superfamily
MIKAILFDADNTMYYTRKVVKKGDMAAMKFFSKQTKGKKSASYFYKEWVKIVDKLKKSRDYKKGHRDYSYSKLAKRFGLKNANKAYKMSMKLILKNLKIEPSFKPSLKRLRKMKKMKFAIITDDLKKQNLPKLRKFRLTKSFHAVITSNHAKTMKPSKRYYQIAFKKLKVKPKACMVVGDSFEKDLKIAKQLGCTTVLFKKKDKRAHHSINNFNQLLKIIRKKNN